MIIPYDLAPSSWRDRTSNNGNKTYVKNKSRFYEDGKSVDIGHKPCVACGKHPNSDGTDACIGRLENVMNACCGHGVSEGYIMFEDGTIIEGALLFII